MLLTSHGVVKLADFGSASRVGEYFIATLGSTLWTAPEILNATHGFQVPRLVREDVWSLGITILELADGIPPYIDQSTAEAIVLITNLTEPPPGLKDPSKWTSLLHSFLAMCLVKQPHNRASAKELLKVRNSIPITTTRTTPNKNIASNCK